MKTLFIARPEGHMEESIANAERMGFRVIAAPMVEVVERVDPEFKVFLKRVLVGEVDFVIFTSLNGIRIAVEKANNKEFINALNRAGIIAIGPRTKRALVGMGINVSILPEKYSSEGIVEELSPFLKGKKVEIVRSAQGDPVLVEGLRKAGASVHEVKIYEVARPSGRAQDEAVKHADSIDVFAFTSSMTVENYLKTAEVLGIRSQVVDIMNKKVVAAIGELTAKTLRQNGIHVDIMPGRFTFDDLLNAIKERVM